MNVKAFTFLIFTLRHIALLGHISIIADFAIVIHLAWSVSEPVLINVLKLFKDIILRCSITQVFHLFVLNLWRNMLHLDVLLFKFLLLLFFDKFNYLFMVHFVFLEVMHWDVLYNLIGLRDSFQEVLMLVTWQILETLHLLWLNKWWLMFNYLNNRLWRSNHRHRHNYLWLFSNWFLQNLRGVSADKAIQSVVWLRILLALHHDFGNTVVPAISWGERLWYWVIMLGLSLVLYFCAYIQHLLWGQTSVFHHDALWHFVALRAHNVLESVYTEVLLFKHRYLVLETKFNQYLFHCLLFESVLFLLNNSNFKMKRFV